MNYENQPNIPWACRACGKNFGGLRGFNDHRYGEYKDEHPHYLPASQQAGGRSCRTNEELLGLGWKEQGGVWKRPFGKKVPNKALEGIPATPLQGRGWERLYGACRHQREAYNQLRVGK